MPRAFVIAVVVATILTVGALPAAPQPQPRAGEHPDAPQAIQQVTATADFNGDGRFDLAVGAPGENVAATADAGAVNIFYGLAGGGLPSTASQTLVQNNPEAGDRFGAALAAGSFNNDSITDLVVGVPGEDVGARADAGAVNVFYGTTGALPATSQLLL
jgi:FG-GAP repeat